MMKQKIKYLVMDIDGSLTDGKIYMGNSGESVKAFSIKDGYSINFIVKPAGITPIVITGRTSKIVENRCREIGIKYIYQGKVEKLSTLKKVIEADLSSCAYFGDDVLDLSCMIPIRDAGGLTGCPCDAVKEVKAAVDYVCVNKAGEGAFREFSEWLVSEKTDAKEVERRVSNAIEYIRSLDKTILYPGKYNVNEYFYYSVQEYTTKPEDECVLESHREYIDIQWIVEGEEAFAISDVSRLVLEKEYDDVKDVMFWKPKQDMTKVILKAGTYIVLYPNDAHMGRINTIEKHYIKKIIGKVKL